MRERIVLSYKLIGFFFEVEYKSRYLLVGNGLNFILVFISCVIWVKVICGSRG